MPEEIQRPTTGGRGAFRLRFPFGKFFAVVTVVALIPIWWRVGQAVTPRIKTFYARTYWQTMADGAHLGAGGVPMRGVYRVLVVGNTNAPLLASQATLDAVPEQVREQPLSLDARAFHQWLKENVYQGTVLTIYYPFIGFSFGSALLLCWLGAEWDWRRRNRALQGTHRRGTRFMGWRRFNRTQLGPLWMLWCLIFWRKTLSNPFLLEAARRGRRLGSTRACYLAATRSWRKALAACVPLVRWLGCRWPGAEGPGISFRVGRLARAVISEELLAYHLNIFGATGMGKSTLIRELLYQIEARGETAVVHDPKREFFREFYDEARGDVVIDPRLEECPYWAMEDEAQDEPEATPWASSLFPDQPRGNPFFFRVPRAIVAYLMSRYSSYNEQAEPASCARLGYWLANGPSEIIPRMKGTEHYNSLNRGGKNVVEISDQSQSLFSSLGELAKPLRMMPDSPAGRRRFSVKQWARKRHGWIFLSSEPVTQEAMMPLHSTIADMAILHTQAEVHDRELPRVWFVLDEVATMGPVSQLVSGATKQRASGNPLILGFHDLAQMEWVYGEKRAQTITGQAYTVMTLRTGSEKEAGHIERTIAHEEIDQMTENRPSHLFGHRARNQSNQVRDTAVVTAAQIQALPRFSGYMLQEGRVMKFRIQPCPRRVRIEGTERIIPPLVYRDEPERVAEDKRPAAPTVVPVNDTPPPPYKPKRNPLSAPTPEKGLETAVGVAC